MRALPQKNSKWDKFINSNSVIVKLIPFGMGFVLVIMTSTTLAQKNVIVMDAELNQAQSEAEFLEELHYSHGDFMRLYESLPKDKANRVDWVQATIEGFISPLASIEEDAAEEKIFDLRVVIKFNDMLVKNVVFSHAVHTYWLDCKSCHPKLFIPQVEANKMTMTEIREGKYCGKCHGAVAFPTKPHSLAVTDFRAVCKRCHREKR